jgi:hypothetical protein
MEIEGSTGEKFSTAFFKFPPFYRHRDARAWDPPVEISIKIVILQYRAPE